MVVVDVLQLAVGQSGRSRITMTAAEFGEEDTSDGDSLLLKRINFWNHLTVPLIVKLSVG